MNQEQKELLLKDLCCRLPYNVICKDININVIGRLTQIGLHYNMCILDKDDGDSESCYIYNCKPYLFPRSSMTEEQRNEYNNLCAIGTDECGDIVYFDTYESIDYIYKIHVDVKILILKGHAIDATNLNIY